MVSDWRFPIKIHFLPESCNSHLSYPWFSGHFVTLCAPSVSSVSPWGRIMPARTSTTETQRTLRLHRESNNLGSPDPKPFQNPRYPVETIKGVLPMKLNAKYAVFTVIALTTVYVIFHNERFVVDSAHPAWERYGPFKWWLLPHAVFGTIVLLVAPFQFSDRLRQRFTRAHRIMGRMYVLGAFVLAPTGAYIQYYQEQFGGPRSFTVLGVVDALM